MDISGTNANWSSLGIIQWISEYLPFKNVTVFPVMQLLFLDGIVYSNWINNYKFWKTFKLIFLMTPVVMDSWCVGRGPLSAEGFDLNWESSVVFYLWLTGYCYCRILWLSGFWQMVHWLEMENSVLRTSYHKYCDTTSDHVTYRRWWKKSGKYSFSYKLIIMTNFSNFFNFSNIGFFFLI